jgi:hypothetical protein
VSSASKPEAQPCTHQRRPGTTVCLLCRQEARVAASDRRKKLLLRGTALGIVVAVIALGMSSAATMRSRAAAREEATNDSAASAKVATTSPTPDSVAPQGVQTPAAAAAAVTTPVTTPIPSPAATVPSTPATSPAASAVAGRDAAFAPTIKIGDTPLGVGVIATRTDSGVTVLFDTPEFRTRTPEKFERFLRTTLSQIYGPRMDSVLAGVPTGKIVGQGDLLYQLPTRGIQLPLQPGLHLEVFPEIRPGQEAPLVVRYRAIVSKN